MIASRAATISIKMGEAPNQRVVQGVFQEVDVVAGGDNEEHDLVDVLHSFVLTGHSGDGPSMLIDLGEEEGPAGHENGETSSKDDDKGLIKLPEQ